MSKTIKVILAEDHSIVRDGIKLILERDEAIEVVGVATSAEEVLERIDGFEKADLLLTDIQMPGLDGIQLIERVKELQPDIKVIVLSMHSDVSYVTEAFARGAAGYLLKDCTPDELVFAVKNVHSGASYLSMDLSAQLVAAFNATSCYSKDAVPVVTADFTEREMEVLQLIGEGLTNNEMSERLFLSKRTIEGHRQSLLDKTGCRNTAVLIKYAVQNELVK
jgi:two-component system response regulator NreC